MDTQASGDVDESEIYSYQAIMERGSEELKAAVQIISGGYRPGTDPRTGKLYQIKWRERNEN